MLHSSWKVTRESDRSILLSIATETVLKKLFTVDEYHRMWDAGIFPYHKRYELVRGEIIEMPPPKPPHSGCVNRLTSLFTQKLGKSIILAVQNPTTIDEMSEPVPDVLLLKPRADFYGESHPVPHDILLAIEVSHTTLRFDTKEKGPLYAEAGIREYWILNIPKNVLEVRSEPINGAFTKHEIFKHGQTVSPRAFPEISFRIEEILG